MFTYSHAAFTLAEALITFVVIGVIAVVIILNVTNAIFDNVRAEHTVASKHKFAKAIEQMALNYDIGPYYGTGEDKKDATSEFAQKLSEYYKINKICQTDNLEDCFGYTTIKFPNGRSYDITNAVNGQLFKNGGSESVGEGFDVNTAGILGTDGTRFILAYNKNCESIEPQVFAWNSDGTNNTAAACVAAIIDIDGNKKPNTIGKDISFFNATGLGNNCIIEIGDACFGTMFLPTPVKHSDCVKYKDEWGVDYCLEDEEADDYWLGAVRDCGGVSYLPSGAFEFQLKMLQHDPSQPFSGLGMTLDTKSDRTYLWARGEFPDGKQTLAFYFYNEQKKVSFYNAGSQLMPRTTNNIYAMCQANN